MTYRDKPPEIPPTPPTPWYGWKGFLGDLRFVVGGMVHAILTLWSWVHQHFRALFRPWFWARLLLVLFPSPALMLHRWRENGGQPNDVQTNLAWFIRNHKESCNRQEYHPFDFVRVWGFLQKIALTCFLILNFAFCLAS